MAKTRLNNDDRNNIAAAVIAHKYDPLQEANEALEFKLAAEVYDRVYPAAVQKKMADLGRAAFSFDADLDVTVNGQRVEVRFSRGRYSGNWRTVDREYTGEVVTKPVFYNHSQGYALQVLDDDDLGARIIAREQEEEQLREDRVNMRQKLDATLANFRYFDDLLTAFPEAEFFIMRRWRERPEGGSPGVPALVIKDLALQLGLPPGEKMAA